MSTVAKPGLLDARKLLLQHLDMRPGNVPADLDPAEVGIVGDPAHVGGYHCGSGRLYYAGGRLRDYSVVESSRDARGLKAHPDWASALDVGDFRATVRGKVHTLASFSVWLVALCKAGDPDARDIREVIYSPDGRTVRRWDGLGIRSGGDESHRWHTHISEYRDADGTRMVRLVRRYLIHIGLIEGESTVSEQDVTKALYKAGPYASKGVGAALKKDGWAETSLRAVTEYTWAATRALTAAAKAQDAKLDLILARLTDAADVEAKVDALAQAEAQRAEADRLRDELVLAAVTADDTVPPAEVPGGGTTRPGQ